MIFLFKLVGWARERKRESEEKRGEEEEEEEEIERGGLEEWNGMSTCGRASE